MLNNMAHLFKRLGKMFWEFITSIFEGIFSVFGVITVVFGGSILGVIVWIYRKPKVYLLSKPTCGWFYIYKDGKEKKRIDIVLYLKLQNKGKENTKVSVSFETTTAVFHSDDKIELQGFMSVLETKVVLYHPFQGGYPQPGECLHGVLKLRPRGNRRLLIFGKKYVTTQLDIPEKQSEIYHSIHDRMG